MKRSTKSIFLTTLAAATIAVGGLVADSPAAEAAGTYYGCPYGAVCLYPTTGGLKAGPMPGAVFYSYGAHNLHNVYGRHILVNNQYGNAGFHLCRGYNGTKCYDGYVRITGSFAPVDFTPIDSIVLVR